jgi:UDP-2-acetamido-3-amino-2,3-dideoxy-glucuronate N-acetyltransferase
MAPRIHATAEIDEGAAVGEGSAVWQLAHVRSGAQVGRDVVIGRGAYIGPGVQVGDACKIQNHALVYEPATLDAGVFVGPAVVLTNDEYPRAVNPDGSPKALNDWQPVGVHLREGSSIGARSVCVAPVTIGRWALVAAGSVVVRDVPDFALVAGTPARWRRWVGRAGLPLEPEPGSETIFVCPKTGSRYEQRDAETLVEVDQ